MRLRQPSFLVIMALMLVLSTACQAGERALAYDARDRVLYQGDPGWHSVCLTFDDGPNPETLPQILDILAQEGVKATFFLIGERAERYPDLVRRIVEEGHELGNHTMTHSRPVDLTQQELLNEIDAARRAIEGASGVKVRLFRPPGGRVNLSVLGVIGELGYSTVLWTHNGRDWRGASTASQVTAHATRVLEPGSIILLHDGNLQTVAALPEIIREIKQKPLFFSTVGTWSELLARRARAGGEKELSHFVFVGDGG